MPSHSKKMMIIDILQILKKYTDENHTLTQKDIVGYLEKDYGMKVDRKSVKRNISDLIEAGFPIDYKEIPRVANGIYPADSSEEENVQLTDFSYVHEFTDSELKLLIDGILFSKHIHTAQKKGLIQRLENLSSKYFRTGAKNILLASRQDSGVQELFLNMETIEDAIRQNKQLDFNYLEYKSDKKLHKRITKNNKVRRFSVNPYQIAAVSGRYYLICNNPWFGDTITNFRIDRMTNLHILEENIRPATDLEGYKNGFSLPKHINEHLFMYSDKTELTTFRCKKTLLSELFDWFDPSDMRFSDETEDEITVTVHGGFESMRLWATEFVKEVTILHPKKLREQVKEDLIKALSSYED